MTTTSPVLGCLPLLADILGRSYGVVVEIGGLDAYTDGRTIRLPSLPITDDPDFLGIVRGYIDHEAAHIRHTDTAAMAKELLNPLEKHVWNAFEDWRVERELAKVFPGCAANFRWLIRKLFLDQTAETPLFAVLDWLLYTVRSWAVPELAADRDRLAVHVKRLWPGLIPRIEPILEQMPGDCPDSLATLHYARMVIRCFQEVAATTPMARDYEPEGSEGEASDPASQAGPQKAKKPGKGKKGKSGKTASEKDPSSLGDSSDLRDLLAALGTDLPGDLGEILKRTLVQEVQVLGQACAVARVAPKLMEPLDANAKREIRDVASGLTARLHGQLQASRLVRVAPSRRGVLNPHRLHGIAVNDPKLFLARLRKPGIDTTVHLLLDTSGSMRKRIALAGQCCWAVAQALAQAGIPVAITAFPGLQNASGMPTVSPILKLGERIGDARTVEAIGGTPLGEALWWVLQRLVPQREARKIVFVLTDGVPDDPPVAVQAIAAAEKLGVEVYGLGIASQQLDTLLPNTSVAVEALAELPQAVFELVGGAVLPKAQRAG